METKAENLLEAKINLRKFPASTPKYYELQTDNEWVKELLAELNEKAEEKSPEDYLAETSLSMQLEISKEFKQQYGEYLLVKGELEGKFVTQCVRTLEDMPDSIQLHIKACFLDRRFEKEEEFAEQLEIFEKDTVFELYFYDKGFIDLKEMIHEQIYLNINQYPVKDPDAPLHWEKETPDTKQ